MFPSCFINLSQRFESHSSNRQQLVPKQKLDYFTIDKCDKCLLKWIIYIHWITLREKSTIILLQEKWINLSCSVDINGYFAQCLLEKILDLTSN